MHQIVGGNAFKPSMDANVAGEASCSTCVFTENFSNYWTQVLYFRARNGTFKQVPLMADQGYEGANGGMHVYYMTPNDTSVKITVFPPGFRMLAGNPYARNASMAGVNLYRCYTSPGFIPNPSKGVLDNDTVTFPTVPCPGGLRVATFFGQCWDGVSLDSDDHRSHIAYFEGVEDLSDAYTWDNGTCPPTHPVRIPGVFVQTVWDTGIFPTSEWPEDGSQPFVWSQGDGTGFGAHGDYVFGWVGDSLQQAIDTRCDFWHDGYTNQTCLGLTRQSYDDANACLLSKQVVEPDGENEWLDSLPGGLTVTYE